MLGVFSGNVILLFCSIRSSDGAVYTPGAGANDAEYANSFYHSGDQICMVKLAQVNQDSVPVMDAVVAAEQRQAALNGIMGICGHRQEVFPDPK